ncbi:MAG: UvrB/UvrC motif-containing protein [Gemmatimonadota bacterium]|nr:MAG: UvrB/UvrC motif-containing protein [Gemmatimonadota bacterium]
MATLALPLTDLSHLRRRVDALAENRPAVYRMLDPYGRVIYVGKAKRLRNRLLSYFRASYPEDKAARILNATAEIEWDNAPSEFAALLNELRQIRRFKPVFNVRMNRSRRVGFIKISTGVAPKIYVGTSPGPDGTQHYGPFTSVGRLRQGVRVLNDLMGLRDCSLKMPIVFQEQGDLFGSAGQAACLRHDFGQCTAPCGGFVTEKSYNSRLKTAVAFLEAQTIEPLNHVVERMAAASESNEFELAARWRDRFDRLEWLLSSAVRSRAAIASLSFVYTDPGTYGDDRAYIIRNATVRASAPAPHSPIEREAFRALVSQNIAAEPLLGSIPSESIDEMMLLLMWFRRHPSALNRTVPFDAWLDGQHAMSNH